jgi:serine/threonine protein kinase
MARLASTAHSYTPHTLGQKLTRMFEGLSDKPRNIMERVDGVFEGCNYEDLIRMLEPSFVRFLAKYDIKNITNVSFTGDNSFVVLADITNKTRGSVCSVAIKLFFCMNNSVDMSYLSKTSVSPTIVFRDEVQTCQMIYNTPTILVTQQCTPFKSYVYTTFSSVKVAIMSGLQKVVLMHHRITHCDLKLENIVVGDDGELFLIDFDNCGELSTGRERACDFSMSSSECYIPRNLEQLCVKRRMTCEGPDMMCMLFVLLGYVIDMDFWKLMDGKDHPDGSVDWKMLGEKERCTSRLNRKVLLKHIMKTIHDKFPAEVLEEKDVGFLRGFCDFVHLHCIDTAEYDANDTYRARRDEVLDVLTSNM